MFGPIPSTHDLVLHPIAFAAWFGFFVTAINLLPLGQLDGGHVAFAVLGRQQRQLAYATVPILIYLGLTGWPGWIVWVGGWMDGWGEWIGGSGWMGGWRMGGGWMGEWLDVLVS